MVSFNPAITEKLNGLSENILNGHYIFSRDLDEDYLAKRFAKPDAWGHNVSYKASEDPKHIQQYYKIRQEAYKILVNEHYYAGKDRYDDYSYQFLGLAGGNCIGGIRITVSTPEKPVDMPLENDNFRIKELYKEIDFSDLIYCEASRLALLPEFRNGAYLTELFNESTTFSIDTLGIGLVFGRSDLLQTRKFQTRYRNMGFDLIIRHGMSVPIQTMEHMKLMLWAIDFTPDRRYTSILESYNKVAGMTKEPEFA